MGIGIAGCCCSTPTCAIGSDDFSTNDLATAWTVVSGTWSISSGSLFCTAAGIAIFNTAQPGSTSAMVVQIDFSHNTSGRICAVIVGYVDSSNYNFVGYNIGSGVINIFKVVSGAATQIGAVSGFTLNINTVYTAKVCMTAAGAITAYLAGVPVATAVSPVLGTQGGLRSVFTGTATYDNFSIAKSYSVTDSTCEVCVPVISCDGNFVYKPNTVTVTGTPTGTLSCSTCGTFNICNDLSGTLSLTIDSSIFCAGGNCIDAEYDGADNCASGGNSCISNVCALIAANSPPFWQVTYKWVQQLGDSNSIAISSYSGDNLTLNGSGVYESRGTFTLTRTSATGTGFCEGPTTITLVAT